MDRFPTDSESSADEEIKADQVYSDFDMCSAEAYTQLTQAVLSTPSRCILPLPTSTRGEISLLRLKVDRDLRCYLVELPLGLLRDLVCYISTDDFVSVALTCRKFAKLLTDKYIGYQGINFYGELQERDIMTTARLQELTRGFKFVKTYASIRPEIVGIFHIDPAKKRFYSIYRDEIVEGLLGNTADIVARRRSIPGVICADIWGECIVCASDSLIAVSRSEDDFLTSDLENDHSRSLKYMGNGEYIVLLRRLSLLVYSKSLQRLQKIAAKGSFLQLYVPKPDKCVFVTISEILDIKTGSQFSLLNGYLLKNDTCNSLFQQKHAQTRIVNQRFAGKSTNRQIKHILMHRISYQNSNIDFLLILFEDGTLLANGEVLGSGYRDIKLKEELIIGRTETQIHVFTVDPVLRRVVHLGNYSYSAEFGAVAVELWKAKAVIVTSKGLEWCRKFKSGLQRVSKVQFRDFSIESVKVFEEFVMVKGTIPVHFKVITKKRYGPEEHKTQQMDFPQIIIANFAESCYEGTIRLPADLERAIREKIEAESTIETWCSRHISLI